MELPVQLGEKKLKFSRIMTSRSEWAAATRNDFLFGQGANWRHSYLWTILDDGKTEFGTQKIQVIDPMSNAAYYHKKSSNDVFMTYLSAENNIAKARVLPEGTNFYLYYPNGDRYHITQTTNTVSTFRMEGFQDRYMNSYSFLYDSNNLLSKVHGPNTNYCFLFEYGRYTNAVNPGLIRFSYVDASATNVLLAGAFNGWSGVSNPMQFTNGQWIADVNLGVGFHEYKFMVQVAGQSDYTWVTDQENSIVVGPNSNSLAVVNVDYLISRVTASDGRRVSFRYGWDYAWSTTTGDSRFNILLTEADYDEGTAAHYTYYSGTDAPELRSVVKTADDPQLKGPAARIGYTYQTNTIYSGQIYEERALISSQLFARLDQTVELPDGVTERSLTPGGQSRQAITNKYKDCRGKVTEVVKYIFVDKEYTPSGLWKMTDTLGRTTVYTRIDQFGALVSISNNYVGCDCSDSTEFTYTDTNFPFYLASIKDRAGRVTYYTRDASHRPTVITYPDNTEARFSYNEYGKITTNVTRDGAVWRYVYDERGRLAYHTDPMGYSTHYGYDGLDRLVLKSNALGQVTRYAYNGWRGVVTNISYPDNTQEAYLYNTYGQVTSHVDRVGGKTTTGYDSLGFVAFFVDQMNATNHYQYDVDGLLLKTVYPSGWSVSNTYDGIGRKIRETYPDGTSRQWLYDPDGIRTQINRLGWATMFAYTQEGRLLSQTDPLGRTTSFGYDKAGNRVAVTNAMGASVHYLYDDNDRLVSITDCSGSVISNVFNATGRLERRIDANGIADEFYYDALGRQITAWRNGALIASNQYNALGQLVLRQSADGMVISNVYDHAGHLLKTYFPDGAFSENIYSNTFLVRRIDRAGRKTDYAHDALGRVLSQTDNATNTVCFRYDVSGNMTNLVDQRGIATTFRYDHEGRQAAKIYADGSSNGYTYNAEGLLTNKLDAKGVSTTYRYDWVGNLTNIDYAADADVFFQYDELNRLVQMTDGIGTSLFNYSGSCSALASMDGPFANDTLSYGYDSGKRLTNVALNGWSVAYQIDGLNRITAVRSDNRTNAYSYLGNGSRIASLTVGNGMRTDYSYDSLLRLTNQTSRTSGNDVLRSFAYVYNNADERIQTARENGQVIDYGYDPISQLVSAEGRQPGYDFNYAYDPAGNPVRQVNNGFALSNSFNNLNQNSTSLWSGAVSVLGVMNISSGAVAVNGQPAYMRSDRTFAATNLSLATGTNTYSAVLTDPFGRTATNNISVSAQNLAYGFDQNGSMTNDGKYAYIWDEADRLKEVRMLDGTLVMSCRYDGFSRRRERILYPMDGSAGSTNRYIYDGWLVAAITDGSDNSLERYVHGPDLSGVRGGAGGIGGLLSISRDGASSRPLFPIYDGNGNTLAAADSNQTITAAFEYGPFGTLLYSSGIEASVMRYRFSTKEYDQPVALYYYGFRFYSPVFGRWLNRDPLEDKAFFRFYSKYMLKEERQKLKEELIRSLYLFTMNAPIINLDSRGLAIWVCTRPTTSRLMPGNHVYFWDETTGTACGRQGSSTGRGDETDLDIGPERGNCSEVQGGDGMEAAVMSCCREPHGPWFPLGNDCHNALDNCLERNGLSAPEHPRFGDPRLGE